MRWDEIGFFMYYLVGTFAVSPDLVIRGLHSGWLIRCVLELGILVTKIACIMEDLQSVVLCRSYCFRKMRMHRVPTYIRYPKWAGQSQVVQSASKRLIRAGRSPFLLLFSLFVGKLCTPVNWLGSIAEVLCNGDVVLLGGCDWSVGWIVGWWFPDWGI